MKRLYRLKLRSAGMFSNVNEVVEQLRRSRREGYEFQIDWSASCYRDKTREEDPWSYYFEPCFPQRELIPDTIPDLPGGVPVACCRDNIITPRLDDGQCNPLLLPNDRYQAHDLIREHLHPKPHVAEYVDQFRQKNFRPRMIGLHIRGPGRTDGGVPELRKRYASDFPIPLEPFFRQLDAALDLLPDAGIFACSDSSQVIEKIQETYGDRVISQSAQRSDFGEMHANHPRNQGQTFDNYKLGFEVLTDALLLSKTDIFVHGNSNVANFVLCAAPYLLHAYVHA